MMPQAFADHSTFRNPVERIVAQLSIDNLTFRAPFSMATRKKPSDPAIAPPIEPMLAKVAHELPRDGAFLFEPKWDGFRAIVFRTDSDVFIRSRDLRPLDRYFPDLHEALLDALPKGSVLDGEIVIATTDGLDFGALQLRLHPAAPRVAKLAAESPASFVTFDLLGVEGRSLMRMPQSGRREALEKLLAKAKPPLYLTPVTRERAMIKVKHVRTADCVAAGFRWHKKGEGVVGPLLLGLYDDRGVLQHVGVTSSFTMAMRKQLAKELEPLRRNAMKNHPWRDWAGAGAEVSRMPGAQSRWSAGKNLSWEPLRVERVCEVKYDHLQGDRFRHAAIFQRWRPDKPPSECRYDQLEVTTPYELKKVFGAGRRKR